MTDVLIRGVPDSVVATIDAKARRLGISRSEFLRRALAREGTGGVEVTVDDLAGLTAALPDLADDEVMRGAWE